jgi:hypothetical protein
MSYQRSKKETLTDFSSRHIGRAVTSMKRYGTTNGRSRKARRQPATAPASNEKVIVHTRFSEHFEPQTHDGPFGLWESFS